jgi:hypothetical protein
MVQWRTVSDRRTLLREARRLCQLPNPSGGTHAQPRAIGSGDELIGFFGFPAAHEDDPLRAVRAVLDVRTAVHSLTEAAAKLILANGTHYRS